MRYLNQELLMADDFDGLYYRLFKVSHLLIQGRELALPLIEILSLIEFEEQRSHLSKWEYELLRRPYSECIYK